MIMAAVLKLFGVGRLAVFLAGGLVILAGVVWVQSRTIAGLNADLIIEQGRYGFCSDRLTSILEDKERRHEIDRLGPDALRDRAAGWLRALRAVRGAALRCPPQRPIADLEHDPRRRRAVAPDRSCVA